MAIVVTGPNNYVGIKANKIHPSLLPLLSPREVLDEGSLARRRRGPLKGGRVKNKTRPK